MPAADARGLHPPRRGQVGGAEAHALDARAGAGDLLQVGHALGGLEHAVDQDRPFESGLRLQLGEQAIDVVDVPRSLDLRDHDDLELVADLGHELGQVVEHIGRGELVHARPQRCVAQVHLLAHPDQAGARGLLAVERHGVLEVAEQDVDLGRDVGHLGDHLLIGEVEEVDHPGRLERDLAGRLGSADGEGLEEVTGVAQCEIVSCGASVRMAVGRVEPKPYRLGAAH